MAHSNTILHQVLQLIPRHDFGALVKKHLGNPIQMLASTHCPALCSGFRQRFFTRNRARTPSQQSQDLSFRASKN